MKKFLFKTFLFISIFILFDRLCGIILQNNRPVDYQVFLDSKTAFFKDNSLVDILIIGDSHIADALDPRTLEANTTLTSYNLGIYHSSPFENYFVTKAALEKLDPKPKYIVLGTNPVMFERDLSKGKYTPLILPRKNKLELIHRSKEGFDVAFFLNFVREKYLIKPLLKKVLGSQYNPTRIIENVYKGHSKFYNQIPNTKWSNFDAPKESTPKKEQVDYFAKTIELALQHDISVIIVHPPIWKENLEAISSSHSYNTFKNKINELTAKYSLETYNDYINNGLSPHSTSFMKNDFLNAQHLNYNGSIKFTKGFSNFLKNK